MALQLHHPAFLCLFDKVRIDILTLEFEGDIHAAANALLNNQIYFALFLSFYKDIVDEFCFRFVAGLLGFDATEGKQMLENEVCDVEREYREGIVEGVILLGCKVIENNWNGREMMFFKSLCVRAFKYVFPDNQDCNSRNSNVLLRTGLVSIPINWGIHR